MQAAINRMAYPTISLSDIQEGMHNTREYLSNGGDLTAKPPSHRFKDVLKGLGLFSSWAITGFRREAAINWSVGTGVLTWTLVLPVASDNLTSVVLVW